MKIFIIFSLLAVSIYPQTIVNDFDGNVYNTVQIGAQFWLKENLKSLHYSDGAEIPGTVGYNNSDSLINIYGRLYTWAAAMRNSTTQGVQGVCPDGWHVPTDAEWVTLENFLGGAAVAGGKMKEAGTAHWNAPNTGADNSSGFTALPGGEYDDYYTPHQFRLLNEYAVFWTSTQVGSLKARERYIEFSSTASSIYDWFKVMKYSIRCVKNSATDVSEMKVFPHSDKLIGAFPNPFREKTSIRISLTESKTVTLKIYNIIGEKSGLTLSGNMPAGFSEIEIDGTNLTPGVYLYVINAGGAAFTGKLTRVP